MRRQPKPLPWRNLSLTKSSAGGSACRSGTSTVAGGTSIEVARVRITEAGRQTFAGNGDEARARAFVPDRSRREKVGSFHRRLVAP
jgi:hypothetical protein